MLQANSTVLKHTKDYNIAVSLNWIQLAQDRIQWRAPVNTAIELRIQ
jgi:hypothetical protein